MTDKSRQDDTLLWVALMGGIAHVAVLALVGGWIPAVAILLNLGGGLLWVAREPAPR